MTCPVPGWTNWRWLPLPVRCSTYPVDFKRRMSWPHVTQKKHKPKAGLFATQRWVIGGPRSANDPNYLPAQSSPAERTFPANAANPRPHPSCVPSHFERILPSARFPEHCRPLPGLLSGSEPQPSSKPPIGGAHACSFHSGRSARLHIVRWHCSPTSSGRRGLSKMRRRSLDPALPR